MRSGQSNHVPNLTFDLLHWNTAFPLKGTLAIIPEEFERLRREGVESELHVRLCALWEGGHLESLAGGTTNSALSCSTSGGNQNHAAEFRLTRPLICWLHLKRRQPSAGATR